MPLNKIAAVRWIRESISNPQNGETHSQEQEMSRGTTPTPSNSYTKDSHKTWKTFRHSAKEKKDPAKERNSGEYRL
ncbi:hypothetical protein AVEN_215173-1 [Araneus ventricosus]|uniref:Uncharacterized protein n=1 Tax=Araneus ventricosus TaxID=182803 RepID=A0A4Y2FRF3_ARAVE|nr:hypothetical protein AVEN_215173-1 [Araneus ventricosus]